MKNRIVVVTDQRHRQKVTKNGQQGENLGTITTLYPTYGDKNIVLYKS